jgi:hypothetical protein
MSMLTDLADRPDRHLEDPLERMPGEDVCNYLARIANMPVAVKRNNDSNPFPGFDLEERRRLFESLRDENLARIGSDVNAAWQSLAQNRGWRGACGMLLLALHCRRTCLRRFAFLTPGSKLQRHTQLRRRRVPVAADAAYTDLRACPRRLLGQHRPASGWLRACPMFASAYTGARARSL